MILNLEYDEAIHYWAALIILRVQMHQGREIYDGSGMALGPLSFQILRKMEDDFRAAMALERAGVQHGGIAG